MVVFASISKPVFLCIIPDLSSILFFLLPNKRKTLVSRLTSVSVYPDPGSNRDGFYSTGV